MKKVDEAIAAGETKRLWIDFKDGDTLDDDIARLPELEELALRNCPAEIVLPNALRALPKLREMTLTSIDDKLVLPKSIADLPLQHVGVWDLANLDDLALLRQIKSLYIVVRETKRDVAVIAKHLPHLTRLELWGSHLKSGELPPEIARFTNLEVLHVVSCGVSDLPREILELKKLREVQMRGVPMTAIPDVVCDIGSLEHLQASGLKLTGLPPNLPKLRSLKTLDLSGALNGGAMISSFDELHTDRMKPIPKVLADVSWIEELFLGRCGVVDASPLRALTKLKTLKLEWSGISTLEDVGTLTKLKSLSIDKCGRVQDFSPLAKLTELEQLKMGGTKPASLDFLRSLTHLKKLDVKQVRCDDITALYELDLEKLEASDEISQKWKDRHALRNLPSIDDVKRDLESSDAAVVSRALSALAKHVRAASGEDSNALGSFFDLEAEDETTILDVPLLDGAITKHARDLSGEALADIFGASLLQLQDNHRATLLVIDEVARRQDEALEQRIVTAFQEASEHYDAGHRYDENTVHDQLVDDFLPKLEAAPLATLLEWCGSDHLNREGGDRMDALFVPAFARVKDDATWTKLTEKLASYASDQAGYGHVEAVDALIGEIESEVGAGWKARFAEFVAKMRDSQKAIRHRAQIRADAESRDVDRIVRAISEGKTLDDASWKDIRAAFGNAVRQKDLPWDARRVVLDRLLSFGDENWMTTAALASLAGEDAARLRREIEALSIPKERLAKLLRTALIETARLQATDERKSKFPAEYVATWASELDGISNEAWRAKEIAETLKAAATSYEAERILDAVNALAELPGSIDMTEKDSSYGGTIGDRLADAVGQLVTYAEEPMFALSMQLHKILLLDKTRERILAQLFGLAAANDREDVIAALVPLLPDRIENAVLAYNLACHSAKKNDKGGLLKFTARSLELGKSPTQFQADSDFAAFLDDGDFKSLLAKAL